MDMFSIVFGILVGLILATVFTSLQLKNREAAARNVSNLTHVALAALALLVLFGHPTSLLAQANDTITIPTDVIFTETNTWITTFAPIAAIGIGITVALAVLGYLGKMIAGAFKA